MSFWKDGRPAVVREDAVGDDRPGEPARIRPLLPRGGPARSVAAVYRMEVDGWSEGGGQAEMEAFGSRDLVPAQRVRSQLRGSVEVREEVRTVDGP